MKNVIEVKLPDGARFFSDKQDQKLATSAALKYLLEHDIAPSNQPPTEFTFHKMTEEEYVALRGTQEALVFWEGTQKTKENCNMENEPCKTCIGSFVCEAEYDDFECNQFRMALKSKLQTTASNSNAILEIADILGTQIAWLLPQNGSKATKELIGRVNAVKAQIQHS